MGEMEVLRVGVCGCAPSFHGKFTGLTVSVQQFKDGALEQPRTFTLEEVIIPEEGDQRDALRDSRTHFFFDVHPGQTSITWIELIPHKRRQAQKGQKDYLYIGGFKGWIREQWYSPEGLGGKEVCRAIEKMLSRLTREKFEQWFLVMNARR